MIQEIAQIQDNDIFQIDPLNSDHFQFELIDVKILGLNIVIVIENSILFEHHHLQGRLFL